MKSRKYENENMDMKKYDNILLTTLSFITFSTPSSSAHSSFMSPLRSAVTSFNLSMYSFAFLQNDSRASSVRGMVLYSSDLVSLFSSVSFFCKLINRLMS